MRRHGQWAALVAPILSLGGVAAYFSYLWVQSGTPWEWYDVEQQIWHSGGGIYHNTVGLVRVVAEYGKVQDVVAAAGLAWVVLGFVAMLRWRPPAVMWIFTAGVVLAAFTLASVGPIPRMFLVAFPLMVAVVRWSSITVFYATLATSGFVLALLTVLTVGLTAAAP